MTRKMMPINIGFMVRMPRWRTVYKYLTKVLYARRASYIRDKMVEVSREISIEDCSGEVDDVYGRLTARLRNVSKPS